MLGDEQRSSNMEKISATLSQIFGDAIRLETYVENDQLESIIYERGYIESQPDKATDDQSPDKEHIKKIQRTLGSTDFDEGIEYKMDNNPARRSSESSEEEDTFVLAPEPPDEPDDVWDDAPLYPNVEHHQEKTLKSEVSSERNREPPHTKAFHEEAKGKIPRQQLREEDLPVGRTVLETDVDTQQQKWIQQAIKSTDVDKWKLEAHVNSDEVKITFHVLIPSNVDFQTDTDKVVLCIWERDDSQHHFIEVEMEFVCYRQDGRNAAQLTGYIILKKDKKALSSLRYNYYIERSGVSLETNIPRQSTWEHRFFDSKLNKRKLHCTALKNNQGPNQNPLVNWGKKTTHMSDCLRLCIEKGYKINDKGVKKTLWGLYTDVLHNLVDIDEDLSIQRKISVCLLMLNVRHFVGYKSGDPANELLCKGFRMTVCTKNRSTVEWDYLQHIFFVQDRMSIKMKLIELAKDICSDVSIGKNPSWMYLLPVLHFLNGFCRPFQEIPLAFDHQAKIPKWWGIDSEIEHITDIFKKTHYHWCISLRHVIEKLKYMFEVDIYLPRTMMASLRIEELKDALDYDIFPYEIGCASIYFFLRTLRVYDVSEKALQKCTETLQRHMLTAKNDRFGPRRVLIGLRTSCDLYSESLCRLNSELTLNTVVIFFSFVARFDILQLKSSKLAEELSKVSLNLNVVSAKTFEWINKIQRKHLTMFNLLQIWDQLLRLRGLPHTFHIEEWMQIVITELRERIHTTLVKDFRGQFKPRLVEAYIAGIDTYSKELQDLLSSFILMALAEQHNENTAVYLKLYDTVSKRFLTEWNGKLNDNKSMNLETIVTWTALPKLIKVLCHESTSNDQNKECQEIINLVKALVEDFVCVILDGKICVKLLQLMENQKDVLFPLCDVLKFNTELIRVALLKRREELNVFYRTRATLEALKLFCDGVDEVQVDMEDVEDLLQKNVEESALNELVIVQKLTEKSEEMTHIIQINAKSLNEDVINMITCLEELKKSGCFTAEWKRVILDLKIHTSLSLNDLYEHVYLPSIESLKEKAKQISSGEIAYVDMEDFVGRICGLNYDTILFELKTVCPDISPKVLSERVEQFKQCRQIRLATQVASAFFKVKDVYGLSGNFSAVDHLKNYDITTLTLSSKKEDILISSRDLNHVTKEGAACVEAFANCADLISWLRDIIKGGIKEVNVFVDLGMTSAGDDIEKISRVQSLHVAVNGYATLIFELEETSGFKEVLKACDSVFGELQNTPKLPEKLEYAQRYLHWFKEIKQAHGSVEVTSFMQAENINECGIYQIGTKVWKTFGGQGSQFSLAEFSDINKVLKLTLSIEGNEGSNPEYTYDKLQDLQSRLMLVAGEAEKSKISVERFNQILEGVVRLCNIYIKLVKSGCMFFQNFAIELVCDTNPNRPIAASLYLANQESILQQQCTKGSNISLLYAEFYENIPFLTLVILQKPYFCFKKQ
ncbi:E3 ubiquitin-protein ligase rnf213-alpha-like [Ruditapes philippinarum]|uniref:E3 ubiquitin-protein ligase rnf213-alpha-like n=1 Tax=Ruditapes philippinarum TaxID=129788 RepID=UPI00295BD31E|nr:E3 ubiquitin-protein ligase rnf213-alpha-like [Ruditapes philippinarum]